MSVFDTINAIHEANNPQPVDNSPPTIGDTASQGLRAGMYDAGGQLNKVAGTAMDAIGLDGSGRHAASAEYQADANRVGADLPQMKDVHDVGSGLRYAAGTVGRMIPTAVPAIGAGLMTGGAAIPAMAAGAAATLPFTLGSQLERQEQDPANANASAGDRLRAAFPSAVGQAAVQNIVPGGVAARLAAHSGEMALGKTAMRFAGDTAANGVASGGSEAIAQYGDKQLNPDAQYDQGKIMDAGKEGLGAGAIFAGAGAAGHIAHSGAGAALSVPAKAFEAAKAILPDKLPAPAELPRVAGTAPEASSTPDVGIPEQLAQHVNNIKDSANALLDKMAGGKEVADPAEMAANPEAAQAKADGLSMAAAKEWGTSMLHDAGLTPEKRADLTQAMGDLTDKANQQIVAGIAKGQQAIATAKDAVGRFADTLDDSTGASTAAAILKSKLGDTTKHSEDFSDSEKKIASAAAQALGPDHPVMQSNGTMEKFAGALRPMMEDMAAGKPLSADHISALIDVTGDKTHDVLSAVHDAIGDPSADKEQFFQRLNQVDAIAKGKQDVMQTMQKNLKPELQDSVRPSELKAEADLLDKWAKSGSPEHGGIQKPTGPNERQAGEAKVRAALEYRYGDKADLVLKAVEKNMKTERHVLDPEELRESSTTKENGSEHTQIDYYGAGKELYDTKANGKNGFDSGHKQMMAKAVKENPGGDVRMVHADELGADHPAVEHKMHQLMQDAKDQGMKPDEAKTYAEGRIKDFGLVRAESMKQETTLNPFDLNKMRLDAKSFGKSPSRVQAGDHILDAVKMVRVMSEKMKGMGGKEDTTPLEHTVAMFKEGVAAVSAHLGKKIDVPDSTRLTPNGLTWGEAKRLDMRTGADKASDAKSQDINRLRAEYKAATTMKERAAAAEKGKKLVGEKQWDVIKEQNDHINPPRGPNTEVSEDGKTTTAIRDERKPAIERDPENDNVHKALQGEDHADAIKKTNNDGSARNDTVMGRRKAATSVGEPPSPKVVAAKKAALVEKAASGDKALTHELATSEDTKGLQRAVEALNEKKKPNEHTVNAIDEANKRIAELIQKPGEAYGMMTTKYSLASTQIHDSLGKTGIAATHDSPYKFDGKFDWRSHAMKGEGAMVKGAGTYLSTSDTVHKYYKAMMTEKAPDKTGLGGGKSPTYHVSVDIPPDHMMMWDKPISEQNPTIKATMERLIKENGLDQDIHMLDPATDRGEDFYRALSAVLDPKDEHTGDRLASDLLQKNGIDAHEMKAASKDGKPNYVIYNDDKISTNFVHFDQTQTDPNHMGPTDRAKVEDYLKTVAPHVAVAWKSMMHAGEFNHSKAGDMIKLSVHSLNPMGVAFHESMHSLFQTLKESGQTHISDILEKAGASAGVMNQLKELLKDSPGALKQLGDAEERAAYMYQFHAQGRLHLGPQATGIFERIGKFLRSITGMWTNDERAEMLMNHFQSGEFEKQRGDLSAVERAIGDSQMRQAFTKLKNMTEPFREMSESIASSGGVRMRESGIDAYKQIADLMKPSVNEDGTKDAGYLPTSRRERAERLNTLMKDLHPYKQEAMDDALSAMQNGVKATTVAGRNVQVIVQKHLADTFDYMQKAGVKISAIKDPSGAPYFPRVWDASYISSHQRQFQAMLDKYVQSGRLNGNPRDLMNKMMVTDGSEFHINTDGINKPGNQFTKERVLSMISHADAAPFMRNDMNHIMSNYIGQATRRAEFARRFGDDGKVLNDLFDAGKKQGASQYQQDMAQKFVKAVDGTLGDNINPTARRLIGNMIVYQNIRLLPFGIFSSAVDAQGIMVRGGTIGDAFGTFTRGMREVTKNFQKDPKSDKMTQLAEAIGTIDSSALIHAIGSSYSQGMTGDMGRKINDSFFRYNFMEQYNQSMRVGATGAAMKFIVNHATNPGEHSVRFLRELGLTAGDVKTNPDGSLKVLQSDGLSLDDSAKMKAAVNRWVDGAILRPDAVDKPVWMSDPHYALVAHLKQFVYAFHETILKRVVHEAKLGNYSPAMTLAGYVPMMLAADMVKGLIQGGGSQPDYKQDWGPAEYLGSAAQRAGLLGTGQFVADAFGDIAKGGNGVGALEGPTIEQLTDSIKVLGGREQFSKFAVDSMPMNSLFKNALHQSSPDAQFAD